MNQSSLMFNSYNPYGDFNSDIGNIIETEKKLNEESIKSYNNEKNKLIPLKEIQVTNKDGSTHTKKELDIDYIFEKIIFTVNEFFKDFSTKNYNNLFDRSKWTGYGYIFIIIYICYFISKL